MHRLRSILTASLLCACIVHAAPPPPTVGQYEVRKRTATGYDSYGVTLANGQAIGQTAGIPAAITIGGGSGATTWGLIEGTLADQADLSAALAAKLSAATAATTYQLIIRDGDLTIARTAGLQDALDAKEVPLTFGAGLTRTTNTITVNSTQSLAKLSNLTSNGFVKTSGGDGTLNIDTASYQPLADNLTNLSALANAAGVLTNDGVGVLSYTGISTGGNAASDDGKLLQYRSNGSVCITDEVQFNSSSNSAAVSLLRSTSSTIDASIYLPVTGGYLALKSDITLANLGGLASGIPAALAIPVGSAGAPVLFNGAGGTPSTINLSNGSNLPLASGVTGDLPFANLTPATAASKLLGRGAASGVGDFQEISLGTGLTMTGTTLSASGGGKLSQLVYTSSSTPASTSATFPADNTLPQNTEGAALSALDTTITPNNAGSTLLVRVFVSCCNNGGVSMAVALFRDSTADAIQAQPAAAAVNYTTVICFEARVPATSTASTTFKIRFGGLGSTTMYVNTLGATQYFGGAIQSTVSVTEILP